MFKVPALLLDRFFRRRQAQSCSAACDASNPKPLPDEANEIHLEWLGTRLLKASIDEDFVAMQNFI